MSDARIETVFAYEALDSRGNPTVGCVIRLRGGAEAESFAPSGASKGSHEAVEVRDGGERYSGRGVTKAIGSVNREIFERLSGMDALDQQLVDKALQDLDGTANFGRLGSNAVTAVSLTCVRAAATAVGIPLYELVAANRAPLLPMPMINILSGGLHAAGLVDVQDFLVVPVGASSFRQAIEWCSNVRRAAADIVRSKGGLPELVADEGGLALRLQGNDAGVELMTRAIEGAGLRPAEDAAIAIDLAATQLFTSEGYWLKSEERKLDSNGVTGMLDEWARKWPIVSLEDPLSEDDWDGWRSIPYTKKLGQLQILGDDIFVTSVDRLERGIAAGVANAILIKVNQNGTVSGTESVVQRAQRARYATVVSARSGETEDSTIADLAVGWRAGQIKVGSLTRSERLAKWNRLLRIEAELGDRAEFAGKQALSTRWVRNET